jgi:hypothetical protein
MREWRADLNDVFLNSVLTVQAGWNYKPDIGGAAEERLTRRFSRVSRVSHHPVEKLGRESFAPSTTMLFDN